jgi:hypothetical protein
MTIRLSTGLRNLLAGEKPTITATTIAAVDASNTLTDSGSGFFDAGFLPGMFVIVSGFTGAAGNNKVLLIEKVEAGTLTIDSGYDLADDAAGESVTITAVMGISLKQIFMDCILVFYSGVQPTDPDDSANGVKLLEVTVSSGSFTAGTATNGLEFDTITTGVLYKSTSQTWSGSGAQDGTAQSFRLYSNLYRTGDVDTDHYVSYAHLDGSVGVAGADVTLGSTSIQESATTTIDTFNITIPAVGC